MPPETHPDPSRSAAPDPERAAPRSAAPRADGLLRRFAALFEHAPVGIFQAAADGRLLRVNPTFARLTGYRDPAHVQAAGPGLAAFLPRADLDVVLHSPHDSDHAHPLLETALERRDGSTLRVSVNARRVATPAGVRIEGFLQDVSELSTVRRRTRRLKELVETAGEAIFSADLDGVIRTWNRGAEQLFGYSAEEAVGRPARELLILPGQESQHLQVLASVRRGEHVQIQSTQRRRKGNEVVDVAATFHPVRDAGGAVAGVAISCHDIRGRRRESDMRLALTRQRLESKRLHELERTRRQFVNEATHELKTPLTPIVTYLHLLVERKDLDETTRSSLRVVERNAVRIVRLVNDLGDTARLATGRFQIAPRPMDLRRLIRDVRDSFRQEARQKGVQLELELPGPLLVEADHARITQVLYNLFSNAVRFSPPLGTVRVAAERVDEAVAVRVQDTGPGLPPEHLARLFEPFDVFHEGDASGSGLGLFITRGIVEAHGGEIRAQTGRTGRGLVVSFTLPGGSRMRGEPGREARPAVPPAPRPALRAPARGGGDGGRRRASEETERGGAE